MVCLPFPPIGEVLLQIRRQASSDNDNRNNAHSTGSSLTLSTGAIFGIALSSAFSLTVILVALAACVIIRRRERRQRQRGQGEVPLGSEPSRSRATTPTPSMAQTMPMSTAISHATLTVPSQNHPNRDRLQRAHRSGSALLSTVTEADLAHPGTARASASGSNSSISRSDSRTVMQGTTPHSTHSTHSASSGLSLAAVEAALLQSATEAHLPPPAVRSLIQSLRRTFQRSPGTEAVVQSPESSVTAFPSTHNNRSRRYVLADDDRPESQSHLDWQRQRRPLRRWATLTATSTADSYETWEPGSSDLVAPSVLRGL